MSNYVKLATDATDQYLAALAESQEQFLKYVQTVAAWTPAVAPIPMPGLAPDYLPTPREISEASFAFATKLLKQQQAFTEKLLASTPAS